MLSKRVNGYGTRDFDKWYEEHKPNCEVNHEGSSSSMEVVGTERIWRRSIAKNRLHYTTITSDGDSKAFNNLVAVEPYGPDVSLVKHECVGHVQKWMYYALTTLKKSVVYDNDDNIVKFGGAGRLTDASIKAVNVYYGGAIVGDIDGMICDPLSSTVYLWTVILVISFVPLGKTAGVNITEP